ncbi:MAG: hypothetical protein ACR2N5_03965 [Solirubrobacterales bacterium]
MPELAAHIERTPTRTGGSAGGTSIAQGAADERPARHELRRQISLLERHLGELLSAVYPRRGIDLGVAAVGGPRVLELAELERVRDSLVSRIGEARAELGRRTDVEESNRELIEAMISEPEEHRWVRISNEDVGEVECRHWHSRPRWGLLGAILGWWRVKLSSGCPLAGGRVAPPAHRREPHFSQAPQAAQTALGAFAVGRHSGEGVAAALQARASRRSAR